jgi:hypothetical protein
MTSGQAAAVSRHPCPRMRKSEGARAPKRCVLIFWAAFRRPRAASPGPRVLSHARAGLWSHPARYRGRANVVRGPLAAALASSDVSLRAPFATGCRASRCRGRTASLRLAQDLKKSILAAAARTEHGRPHLGTAPRPASDAQACRVPRWAGMRGSVREAGGAGISFVRGERYLGDAWSEGHHTPVIPDAASKVSGDPGPRTVLHCHPRA